MNVELSRYGSRWTRLLSMEHKEQTNLVNDRLMNMTAKQLQKQGHCIMNVKLQIKGNFYGDRIARLSLSDYGPLPSNHQFFESNQILLSRDHPLSTKHGVLRGSILETSRRFIDIVLNEKEFVSEREVDGFWRMDQGVDEQTINRMQSALDVFGDEGKYNGSKLIQKMMIQSMPIMVEKDKICKYQTQKHKESNGEIETFLADQLLLSIKNYSNDSAVSVEELTNEIRAVLNESASELFSLNESQTNAIKQCLQNALSLIRGPPGTGKTKTAIELITICAKLQQLTQKHVGNKSVRKPILATAYTNTGTD